MDLVAVEVRQTEVRVGVLAVIYPLQILRLPVGKAERTSPRMVAVVRRDHPGQVEPLAVAVKVAVAVVPALRQTQVTAATAGRLVAVVGVVEPHLTASTLALVAVVVMASVASIHGE